MTPLSACPFCGGTLAAKWRSAPVSRCVACGLAFRNPMPSPPELERLYRESWLAPDEHSGETGATTLRLGRIYAERLRASLGVPGFEGRRVLDFGAGKGGMAIALREAGAEVVCIEPFGRELLRRRGLRAHRALGELPPGFQADGIVALDVLEHLPEPWVELARLRALLAPEGWLYLSTLNVHGLNALVHGGRWREARKAGHLVFFSPRSLGRVLTDCGFERLSRPRWLIPYGRGRGKRLLHYGLQAGRLETALRFLAFSGTDEPVLGQAAREAVSA